MILVIFSMLTVICEGNSDFDLESVEKLNMEESEYEVVLWGI